MMRGTFCMRLQRVGAGVGRIEAEKLSSEPSNVRRQWRAQRVHCTPGLGPTAEDCDHVRKSAVERARMGVKGDALCDAFEG